MEDIFYRGRWWRFSDYSIRDGYVQAKPEARFHQYEPLSDFQVARSGRKDADPPYVSLIRLAQTFKHTEDSQPTAETAERVLSWCNEYGLLGILLHQVQVARFAPRWELRRKRSAAELAQDPPLRLEPGSRLAQHFQNRPRRPAAEKLEFTQSAYQRTNHGTFRFGDERHGLRTLVNRAGLEGAIVSPKQWPRDTPTVLLNNLETGGWGFEPLSHTWARFFPTIPPKERSTFQYPQPYSETFWRIYAEPLGDFVNTARQFERAYLSALKLKDPSAVDDPRVDPTTSLLNALVTPTGPCVFQFADGGVKRIEQLIVAPSLLGALALMLQQDLMTDRRVVRCQNDRCRMVVLAVGYQTSHCSQQCRYAAIKRAQRVRYKLEAQQNHQGPAKQRGRSKTANRAARNKVSR